MLHILGFTFTAATAELCGARSALVRRAQESPAGLNGTRGDKEALLFGFFGLGAFRSMTDVAAVRGYFCLEFVQLVLQLVLLLCKCRNLCSIGPLLNLDLYVGLRCWKKRSLSVKEDLLPMVAELAFAPRTGQMFI